MSTISSESYNLSYIPIWDESYGARKVSSSTNCLIIQPTIPIPGAFRISQLIPNPVGSGWVESQYNLPMVTYSAKEMLSFLYLIFSHPDATETNGVVGLCMISPMFLLNDKDKTECAIARYWNVYANIRSWQNVMIEESKNKNMVGNRTFIGNYRGVSICSVRIGRDIRER